MKDVRVSNCVKIECAKTIKKQQHNNRIYQYQQSVFAIYLQTPTNEPTNIVI